MRVLFVSSPGIGHVFPMVPLAWALRAAGHDVLVATTGPALAAERAGLPVADLVPGWNRETMVTRLLAERPDLVGALQSMRTGGAGDQRRTAELLAAVSGFFVGPLLAVATGWRPDLLVQSQVQGAGFVAASKLGIPLVEHGFGFVRSGGWAEACRTHLAAAFDHHGVAGLPRHHAAIDVAPVSMLDGDAHGWPMRCVPYNGGGVLPDWVWRPVPGDRPRVAVTLGTSAPVHGGLGAVQRLLALAEDVDAEFVLALGDVDTSAFGTLPHNVRVAGWVPLNQLLPTCSALVHHGGAGTTLTALDAGVPQLVLPSGADRHLNAAAVCHRGAGLSLADEDLHTGALDTVLRDPSLRNAAAEVRAELRAMPTPSSLLPRLEALAGLPAGGAVPLRP